MMVPQCRLYAARAPRPSASDSRTNSPSRVAPYQRVPPQWHTSEFVFSHTPWILRGLLATGSAEGISAARLLGYIIVRLEPWNEYPGSS
jgi:hypothetical protein